MPKQEIVRFGYQEFLVPVHEHFACCQTCAALVPAGHGSMEKHAKWHSKLGTDIYRTIGKEFNAYG